MDSETYISEDEAAKLAGVSVNTLACFAEAGYLSGVGNKVPGNSSTQKHYDRRELEKVFGISTKAAPAAQWSTIKESEPHDELNGSHDNVVQFRTGKLIDRVEVSRTIPPEAEPSPIVTAPPQPLSQQAAVDDGTVTRLKHVIELLEQLMSVKDQRIRDLAEQRDWLQGRIEKLEQRADRDQLLIMTETQMMSRMLAMQAHKRSPFKLALDWLGFTKGEEAQTGSTIEVEKK